MKKYKPLFFLQFLFLITSFSTFSQLKPSNTKPLGTVTASFTAPDTVCVNTTVQINNTSVGASNYYWSFCEANINAAPAAINLGNPGNLLSLPVFMDIAQDASGNYFAFVVNNLPGGVVRMSFGNSLLNTPVADDMGNFGGAIPQNAEGIQVVNVNGNWFIIIDGGDPASGTTSAIVKINLGTSLASTTGVATNWGNIGNMSYPHDLYIFTENNNWYGYTVNSGNNTITQFNFGADFSSIPIGTNLGNLGNLDVPVGFGVINSAGSWHLFVANNSSSLTRLDFGNSLLNTPTAVNIGNPGNSLNTPRDISFVQLCNNTEAYVVNANSNTITQLNFGNNLLATPAATDLGNIGSTSFPHSISKLFRVNSDVYAFVPNVNSNSITQLHFSGCTTPGSTLQNPASVTYSTPGIYNINLLVDLGLPTQTSFCKQIVVKNCPLQTCNNWLNLPSDPSYVSVGNLNITGNQVTVEAMINLTMPFTGGPAIGSDIVTKYRDPTDVNYLLRSDNAQITTDVSFYQTPPFCALDTNKTYHVAMVYDGTVLKFYRNGFLMSSIPATGNLIQNNWPTWIGNYFSQYYNTNFIGYINEVRIWNVARTQAQIQSFMSTSLPSPATQTGLQAYYIFNDLSNKQGNSAWNGTLAGAASINQTNPTCATFIADSCCTILQGTLTGNNICKGDNATLTFSTNIGKAPFTLTYSDGTNTYTQSNVQNNVPFILATQPTANTTYTLLSIQDASSCPPTNITSVTASINVNNCSLCKGSLGDPVVNITFGSGNNPGQPLPAIVPGASTSLTYVAVTGDPATPTPVDGQYTITNNVPANPSWFSGATDHTGNTNGYMAFYNASEQPGEFYSDTVNNLCGSTTYEFAAWIANALNPAMTIGVKPNITFYIAQTDGTILASYNTGDILQTNAFTWKQYGFLFTMPANVSSVVLKMVNNNPGGNANVGNDLAIDDITFRPCGPVTVASFSSTSSVDSLTICANDSANIFGIISAGYNSPNYFWQKSLDSGKTWIDTVNANSLNLKILPIGDYGQGQITIEYRLMTGEGANVNSPNCRVVSNVVVLTVNPFPIAAFIPNETICIGDNATLSLLTLGGLAPYTVQYTDGTNNYTIANIGIDTTFSTPYQIIDTTLFQIVSAKNAYGCINTANIGGDLINVNPLPQGSFIADTVCAGDSASVTFTATAGTGPFSIVLNDGTTSSTYNNVQSGVAFKIAPLISNTTLSLVSITGSGTNTCSRTTDFASPSVNITITPSPQIQFDSIGSVCIKNAPFIITQAKETSGIAGSGQFIGKGVDATGNFSPLIAGAGIDTITYSYAADNGCTTSKSQIINVNQNPVANAGEDLIACINVSLQLNATGGETYVWTPPTGLSNDSIANPVATLNTSTTYTVTVTDGNGCTASDSVVITVSPIGKALYVVPNAFSPNGDGKNDCFGIQHWGGVKLQEFSIYNRWGQLIFATKNPSECWDGSFHGKIQDAGAYVYIIRAQTACGQVSLKGTVVLIK
jgi:gliding motility-associated-like protein